MSNLNMNFAAAAAATRLEEETRLLLRREAELQPERQPEKQPADLTEAYRLREKGKEAAQRLGARLFALEKGKEALSDFIKCFEVACAAEQASMVEEGGRLQERYTACERLVALSRQELTALGVTEGDFGHDVCVGRQKAQGLQVSQNKWEAEEKGQKARAILRASSRPLQKAQAQVAGPDCLQRIAPLEAKLEKANKKARRQIRAQIRQLQNTLERC